MKKCSNCKVEKDQALFNKKGGGLQPYCKECDRERSRKYYIKNKEKQKKQIYASRKKRSDKIREYIRSIKESNPCSDCGIYYAYYVMDFDHQRDKEFLISRSVTDGKTLDAVKEEIDKCEIVCANCHRIRTYS